MRALYISQTGMLEGLGQSQVLAYLRGLAARGVDFDLMSFELPESKNEDIARLRAELEPTGIRWHPLRRARDPRLRVKVSESSRGVLEAFAVALKRRPDIVHGRSYLPTAVADVVASFVPKAKLLFDCRGMIGDEYVDARYWTRDRREYKLVKRYEARALHRAEGIVFLTDALRRWMNERRLVGANTEVATIPCCVDLAKFTFDGEARARIRQELGWSDDVVLVYAGSLGSWYREEQMARFAAIAKKLSPRSVRFLVLTRSANDPLVQLLRDAGFDEGSIAVRSVRPAEVPSFLSAGDVGISFIASCFSKLGSSPTKVAEYLACGLPVVLNGDIGDQGDLAAERDACAVVRSFDDDDLAAAGEQVLRLAEKPLKERVEHGRRVARARFDVDEVGVARYADLYARMMRAS